MMSEIRMVVTWGKKRVVVQKRGTRGFWDIVTVLFLGLSASYPRVFNW